MSKIAQKLDKKRKLIIFLIIVSVVLGIVLCILHALDTIKEYSHDKNKVNVYSPSKIEENPSNYSIEEILTSFGCSNVKSEFTKNEDDEKYFKITLNFKYHLYEGEESQQKYFDTIVKTLSKRVRYPYELIDKNKNIYIYVNNAKGIYEINGVENFYKNNSYVKVNSHQEIPYVKNSKDSVDINAIITNNWKRDNLILNKDYSDIDDEFVYYDNFKFNCSGLKINYVVFSSEYEEGIYKDIKAGTDFKEIEKKLGKPSFTDGNRMIGYKDVDIYVFFYKDEVVVYPTSRKLQNENEALEEKIVNYYENSEELDKALFVKDIIDTYSDFKSELIDDGVKISSYIRGIDIILYDNGDIKITVYDNYAIGPALKILAETKKINLNYENDSIYLYELERK